MRFIIFLLGISFVLASCTKFGKNVTVKGRVLNPVTGEGISGAEVKLYKLTGFYDAKHKAIQSATTDASGNFELNKYTWSSPTVRCEPKDDLYKLGWTKDGGQTFIDNFELNVKKGKVINADFYAVPYGNLKQSIKNISCFDQTDTLFINIKYQISNISNLSDVDVLNTGCVDFSNTPYSKFPMGWYYFSGYYKKNGVVTNFSDSIYITAGGYHEWVFEY